MREAALFPDRRNSIRLKRKGEEDLGGGGRGGEREWGGAEGGLSGSLNMLGLAASVK